MSELKAIRSGEIYNIIEYEDCYRTDDLYYPKSESDKVIAELKESIKGLILDNYLQDKEIRRHKYKRCLAMASTCRLRARWFGDNAFYKKEQWALQWHKCWLKLAEKFKPNNSTAQSGKG